MLMDYRRKTEYPERTHVFTGRTCKLHSENLRLGFESRTFLLQDNSVNNYVTMQSVIVNILKINKPGRGTGGVGVSARSPIEAIVLEAAVPGSSPGPGDLCRMSPPLFAPPSCLPTIKNKGL
ncbi:hypothetical protein CRENBAI_017913 [Crenichthys baileyi]|uniref:Uncharacterized protein n=1 Tax=Crenichthys baileyi TaxID=28760 RepID=A0AAV9SLL4_9TELE